jgi:hypothetical protein
MSKILNLDPMNCTRAFEHSRMSKNLSLDPVNCTRAFEDLPMSEILNLDPMPTPQNSQVYQFTQRRS